MRFLVKKTPTLLLLFFMLANANAAFAIKPSTTVAPKEAKPYIDKNVSKERRAHLEDIQKAVNVALKRAPSTTVVKSDIKRFSTPDTTIISNGNPTFNGSTGWTFLNGGAYDSTMTQAPGTGSAYLSSVYTSPDIWAISGNIPVVGGSVYTARAWVRTDTHPYVTTELVGIDGNNNSVILDAAVSPSSKNQWQEVFMSFTPPSGTTSVKLALYTKRNTCCNTPPWTGNVWFDNYHLVNGTHLEDPETDSCVNNNVFIGVYTDIDCNGAMSVLNTTTGQKEPFFRISAFTTGARFASDATGSTATKMTSLASVFNTISDQWPGQTPASLAQINTASQYGMKSMFQVAQYLGTASGNSYYQGNWSDLTATINNLSNLNKPSDVIAFYADVEPNSDLPSPNTWWAPWSQYDGYATTIRTADLQGGVRRRPSLMLRSAPHSNAWTSSTDVEHNDALLGYAYLCCDQSADKAAYNPAQIKLISMAKNNAVPYNGCVLHNAGPLVSRLVWGCLAGGGKGIDYWADYLIGNLACAGGGCPGSPVEYQTMFPSLKGMLSDFATARDVIRAGEDYRSTAPCRIQNNANNDMVPITWSQCRNVGGVNHLIASNNSPSAVTQTMNIVANPYPVGVVRNILTGAVVATPNGASSFSVTLPGNTVSYSCPGGPCQFEVKANGTVRNVSGSTSSQTVSWPTIAGTTMTWTATGTASGIVSSGTGPISMPLTMSNGQYVQFTVTYRSTNSSLAGNGVCNINAPSPFIVQNLFGGYGCENGPDLLASSVYSFPPTWTAQSNGYAVYALEPVGGVGVTTTTVAGTTTTTIGSTYPALSPTSVCAGGTRYQAEVGIVNPLPQAQMPTVLSGGARVWPAAVSGLNFTGLSIPAGSYQLNWRYYAANPAVRNAIPASGGGSSITGPYPQPASFTATSGGWLTATSSFTATTLTDQIALEFRPSDLGEIVLDYIDLCPSSTTTTTTSPVATSTTTTSPPTSPTLVCPGGIRLQAENGVVVSGSIPLTLSGSARQWSTGPSALHWQNVNLPPGTRTIDVRYINGPAVRTMFMAHSNGSGLSTSGQTQSSFPASGVWTTGTFNVTNTITTTELAWSFDSLTDSGSFIVDYIDVCPTGSTLTGICSSLSSGPSAPMLAVISATGCGPVSSIPALLTFGTGVVAVAGSVVYKRRKRKK